MSWFDDTDQDGHTMDEGLDAGVNLAGGIAKGGGALAIGLGTLGAGLGAGAMGLGGGLMGVGGGLMGAGGTALGLGLASAAPTAGLGLAGCVGGAAAMGIGGATTLLGAGITGLGAAGALASGLLGGAGYASVGIGEILQTDAAGLAAAGLGDFANNQLYNEDSMLQRTIGLINEPFDDECETSPAY